MWKTGLPVRSAVLKPHAGELVVGWVTTSESSLLYVFVFFGFFFFGCPLELSFLGWDSTRSRDTVLDVSTSDSGNRDISGRDLRIRLISFQVRIESDLTLKIIKVLFAFSNCDLEIGVCS